MPPKSSHRWFVRQVPTLLTGLRAILAPVVALLAWFAPMPKLFAVCLAAAFLSDIFDGIIARRIGVATPTLRRLDSAADSIFYAACLLATWHLYPAAITERLVSLCLLVALEVARYLIDILKFRREASYHMWSSKVWGIALFVGFFCLLVRGATGLTLSLAVYVGIVADLEGLAISIALRTWRPDVPSLFHALQIRKLEGTG